MSDKRSAIMFLRLSVFSVLSFLYVAIFWMTWYLLGRWDIPFSFLLVSIYAILILPVCYNLTVKIVDKYKSVSLNREV